MPKDPTGLAELEAEKKPQDDRPETSQCCASGTRD